MIVIKNEQCGTLAAMFLAKTALEDKPDLEKIKKRTAESPFNTCMDEASYFTSSLATK